MRPVVNEATVAVVKEGSKWVVRHTPTGLLVGCPCDFGNGEVDGLFFTRKRDAVAALSRRLERESA